MPVRNTSPSKPDLDVDINAVIAGRTCQATFCGRLHITLALGEGAEIEFLQPARLPVKKRNFSLTAMQLRHKERSKMPQAI